MNRRTTALTLLAQISARAKGLEQTALFARANICFRISERDAAALDNLDEDLARVRHQFEALLGKIAMTRKVSPPCP